MPLDLSEFKRILVLSPHLDDAALSVGGIVDRLTKRGSEIVIATVFTADPPPLKATSALIDFLHKSWDLGPSPIQYRREEDIAAVNVLGARLVHGGLPTLSIEPTEIIISSIRPELPFFRSLPPKTSSIQF
jgi:LmbE family N-acetylglucosaminyl deacetylase